MSKILVIEDNVEVRENLAELLELDGYEVLTAENGKIGVAAAMENYPDLILCDIMMPELDGFGVLKILNRHEALMHTPFMFLTAKAEKTDFRRGMGLGADDYITKPFDDVELLEAIEMRLKKRVQPATANQEHQTSFYNEQAALGQIKSLTENAEVRTYHNRDMIFDAGTYGRYVYQVKSGMIKTVMANDLGKELIVDVLGTEELFGYLPIINNQKNEHAAYAIGTCELVLIPKDTFRDLYFKDKNIDIFLMKSENQRVRNLERHMLDIAYSSVRRKVANALLYLSIKSKSDTIKVLRDDLASLAGSAKETVIRTVSDFKSEGIVDIVDGNIVIVDRIGLEAMPQ